MTPNSSVNTPPRMLFDSFFLVAPEATPCHQLLPRALAITQPDQTRKQLGEAFLDEGRSAYAEGLHGDGGPGGSR